MGLFWLVSTSFAVTGGSPGGDWPWVAAVYESKRVACTGVLVAPDRVLTAAHCSATKVRVGAEDLNQPVEGDLRVLERLAHPPLDAALLVIEPSGQRPAELASGCVLKGVLETGVLVGFGRVDANATSGSTLRQQATLPLRWEAHEAGGDGLDSCIGDSGGPLHVLTDWGRPRVLGIVSKGVEKEGPECGEGGIYVPVEALLDWLQAEGVGLDTPDCSPNTAPVLAGGELVVAPGETGRFVLGADEAVVGYRLVAPARLGEARIDGSTLLYTANEVGSETLMVAADDGRADGIGEVGIRVRRSSSSGCSHVPSPWALVLLPWLFGRRARPA